jgi:hypothetical protein
LVGTGFDSDAAEGAEGAGTASEAEADGVPKEAGRAEVAEVDRVGKRKGCGLNRFDGRVDTGSFGVGASERAQEKKVFLGFRKDDPLSAAGADQRPGGEGHPLAPKR